MIQANPLPTIHVCVTCRAAGTPREEPAEGERLFGGLQTAFEAWDHRAAFALAPVRCMSVCTRPCTVAVTGPGKPSYLFGDLDHRTAAPAVLEFVLLYRERADGVLLRSRRPEPLRDGLIGRIPPMDGWAGR